MVEICQPADQATLRRVVGLIFKFVRGASADRVCLWADLKISVAGELASVKKGPRWNGSTLGLGESDRYILGWCLDDEAVSVRR